MLVRFGRELQLHVFDAEVDVSGVVSMDVAPELRPPLGDGAAERHAARAQR